MSRNVGRTPKIGITMGDAAGIGPEIVVKALTGLDAASACEYVVVGDAAHLDLVAAGLGAENNRDWKDRLAIVDLGNLPNPVEMGVDREATGRAAGEYIERAVDLWRDGAIDAICTAPISKKALALAGYEHPGHTEFLARLTATDEFAMSFFADKLRVVLLSTHLPLTAAIKEVTKDRLVDLIRLTDRELGKLLGRRITIAVAGLNPHASEGGMFGSEEQNEILPAIDSCRTQHDIDVTGPYSPDTIFLRTHAGEFDACIALYHDQATIAVKSLSFGKGVNVTLGLPFVRTSVDHGTAYDIAGRGIADASSMRIAMELAGELTSMNRAAKISDNI